MKNGQLTGALYSNDEEHWRKVGEMMVEYIHSNPLHFDVFSGVV